MWRDLSEHSKRVTASEASTSRSRNIFDTVEAFNALVKNKFGGGPNGEERDSNISGGTSSSTPDTLFPKTFFKLAPREALRDSLSDRRRRDPGIDSGARAEGDYHPPPFPSGDYEKHQRVKSFIEGQVEGRRKGKRGSGGSGFEPLARVLWEPPKLCENLKEIAVFFTTGTRDIADRMFARRFVSEIMPIMGWDNVSVFFVQGHPDRDSEKEGFTLDRLETEAREFNDIVYGSFIDQYANLADKTHVALDWWSSCAEPTDSPEWSESSDSSESPDLDDSESPDPDLEAESNESEAPPSVSSEPWAAASARASEAAEASAFNNESLNELLSEFVSESFSEFIDEPFVSNTWRQKWKDARKERGSDAEHRAGLTGQGRQRRQGRGKPHPRAELLIKQDSDTAFNWGVFFDEYAKAGADFWNVDGILDLLDDHSCQDDMSPAYWPDRSLQISTLRDDGPHFMGCPLVCSPVIHSKSHRNSEPEIHDTAYYPHYPSGTTYLMNVAAAKVFVEQRAYDSRHFVNEDAMLGILAVRGHVALSPQERIILANQREALDPICKEHWSPEAKEEPGPDRLQDCDCGVKWLSIHCGSWAKFGGCMENALFRVLYPNVTKDCSAHLDIAPLYEVPAHL